LDNSLVIFNEGEWAWELIISFLDILKNDFEVLEAMFEGVERP
jgi:hypothetical protein